MVPLGPSARELPAATAPVPVLVALATSIPDAAPAMPIEGVSAPAATVATARPASWGRSRSRAPPEPGEVRSGHEPQIHQRGCHRRNCGAGDGVHQGGLGAKQGPEHGPGGDQEEAHRGRSWRRRL